jgi:hypothetical protein
VDEHPEYKYDIVMQINDSGDKVGLVDGKKTKVFCKILAKIGVSNHFAVTL